MDNIGGIRLKRTGLVSKETLLNEIKIALDSMVGDFDINVFSGVNIYFNMHDKNGDKLALISPGGNVVDSMDINGIKEDFSLKKVGFTVETIKDIERKIFERERVKRIDREAKDAADREKHLARQQKEQAEKEQLNLFKQAVCAEFGVTRVNDVASSVGRITTALGMSKYIDVAQFPDCGYVYRLTLKDQNTGRASGIRIYDDCFQLLHASQ